MKTFEIGRLAEFAAISLAAFVCTAADSSVVREWERTRRAETLRWFEENQFGRTPVGRLPDQVLGETYVAFTNSGIRIDITCRLPKGADAAHPVPVFLFGDHSGGYRPPEFAREEYAGIPTNSITARGYAYVRWNFNDVCPNVNRHAKTLDWWPVGIVAYHATGDRMATNVVRRADGWGTIGAWAWGNSRVMDWIESRPELDAKRVAVVGHSRGGKTALWTGAQDTRFAMAVSNGSGCGGARLGRAKAPKAETFAQILHTFPNWFCPAMTAWIGRDAEVPHDADDLLRLMAPRLVYVASGSEDAWAGPAAEKAAWDAAHDLWRAYGYEERMGYHCHDGPHKLLPFDWERFMDFADRHMKPGLDGRGASVAETKPSDRISPVAPAEFEVLPLGCVRAEGWLLRQLEKQRDGVTGHAEELYDDIGNSDWLTNAGKGGQYAWERGPYYAKGLVALALTLDDAALKAKARRWVDAALASQHPDGDFGPKKDNWWANMIVLHYLRDWAEATGDARVEPFLRRYFAYQVKRLAEHPLSADSAWAACRAGDELEVVLWLYDRTNDAELLTIANLLASQCSDWTSYYHDGGGGSSATGYRIHIVNFMQGLKYPALKSRLTRSGRDRSAYDAAFDPQGWAMQMNGRPDRMVNGTESLSGRDTAQGTELCAIAERILSCREVVAATGNAAAADDMEVVAFNSLPAALGDDGRGLRYYLVLNQPRCQKKGDHGFEQNRKGDATTPGLDAGFGCCRSNYHFAWPKFVQSLWMRKDGGLAAIAYAPSCVATDIATIRTSGNYPFGDDIRLDIVRAKGGAWPLLVRIPSWCAKPCVAINGQAVGGAASDGFLRIVRNWRSGDRVELSFPAEARLEVGVNNSRAVRRGPLVYAFAPKAKIKEVPERLGFSAREYRPAEDWNWVLSLPDDGRTIDVSFSSDSHSATGDPFRHGAKPCWLAVRARKTPYAGWGTYRIGFSLRPIEPPPSPVPPRMVSDAHAVNLLPLGATQIRITYFPWTSEACR